MSPGRTVPGPGAEQLTTSVGAVTDTEKHEFLSAAWVAAAKAIRADYEGKVPPPPVAVRMNQVITDAPWGTVESHIDTSDGDLIAELGHLAEPDLTVTTDYETAKAIFVARDPQVGMQAFLAGKIRVDGDVAKLMTLQTATPPDDSLAAEIAQRISDMTAD